MCVWGGDFSRVGLVGKVGFSFPEWQFPLLNGDPKNRS